MERFNEAAFEKAKKIIKDVLRKLYGDGFLTVLEFHIRKELKLYDEDLVRLLIENPRRVYDALKTLYGGEESLDSFLTVTILAINEMIGHVMAPRKLIEAMKKNDKEIVSRYVKFLVWRYEKYRREEV